MDNYQKFIYLRTYSRWNDLLQRRETWDETVDRVVNFLQTERPLVPEKVFKKIKKSMLALEVLPSMRLVWTAGDAAKKNNAAIFNCAFAPITHWKCFADALYLLMSGCGFGFSVQNKYIRQLPIIKVKRQVLDFHSVEDSRQGWAESVRILMEKLTNGTDVSFDYSKIRKKGTKLKTFGGRSSGPEPLAILHQAVRDIFSQAQGRKLKDIECLDILCQIAEVVVAGGSRRSSEICLFDVDSGEMFNAKNWPFPNRRTMANLSFVADKKPTSAEFIKMWSIVSNSGTGEPGIFNLNAARARCPERRDANNIAGTNPCLTGDTLVALADGRGQLSIKQLAEEGLDVPVYCLDNTGKLSIRYLRNPRLTGYNKDIYRVHLDDGSFVDVTQNHKFRLKCGKYKEAQSLIAGDSLYLLTKYQASIKDVFKTKERSSDYWWLNTGQASNIAEHRLIASFHKGVDIPTGYVVHHKDFNASNNSPDNLLILSKQEHDLTHGEHMKGKNNPMVRAAMEWSPEKWAEYKKKQSDSNSGEKNARALSVTNEEIMQSALDLTKTLNRRFSTQEWALYAKEHSLPTSFSQWRESHFNGVSGLSLKAANQLGLIGADIDPRAQRTYRQLINHGYDCFIENGSVMVRKKCEFCQKEMTHHHSRREVGFCSLACSQKHRMQQAGGKLSPETHAKIMAFHGKKRESIKEQQILVYKNLKQSLGRNPDKNEWKQGCVTANVSFEISRKSSPFRSWKELKEAAFNYNHRVVRVEIIGKQDVFNGTVDEFHNFFIGGFESTTANGKRKLSYINNLQCGEALLRANGLCNLSSVILRWCDDLDDVLEKVETATWLGVIQSTFTDFPYIGKEWKINADEERLLGVSLSGQMDAPHLITPDNLKALKSKALKVAKKASKLMDISMPAAITVVKPEGTSSQMVDSSSGLHPRYSQYYIRRVRIASTDPLCKMIQSQGIKLIPNIGEDPENVNTYVIEFPIKSPANCITRHDMTAIQQLEHYKLLMEHWCEHAASATIYVQGDEWLQVGSWVYDNWDYVVGLTFLPADNSKYELAPYEEITAEQYEKLVAEFPNIDYSQLSKFEQDDNTEGAKTVACSGNSCEL